MVSCARGSALIISAALISACAIREESHMIRYEALVQGAGTMQNGLAFSEEKGLIVGYIKPYSDGYLDSPSDFNAAVFRYREEKGILAESGTGLSIPRNLDKVRSWKNGSYQCKSKLAGSAFKIECSNGMRNLIYEYSPYVGVTKLQFRCRPGEDCEFFLVSRRGLFGGL